MLGGYSTAFTSRRGAGLMWSAPRLLLPDATRAEAAARFVERVAPAGRPRSPIQTPGWLDLRTAAPAGLPGPSFPGLAVRAGWPGWPRFAPVGPAGWLGWPGFAPAARAGWPGWPGFGPAALRCTPAVRGSWTAVPAGAHPAPRAEPSQPG